MPPPARPTAWPRRRALFRAHAALLLACLCLLLGALAPGAARAHALDPAYLEITHIGGDGWRVLWRKPAVGAQPMAIEAALPETCSPRRPPPPRFDGRAFTARWLAECPEGLAGGTIAVQGLDATGTDVLVRYTLRGDARAQTRRLTAAAPAFSPPPPRGLLGVMADYFTLGVEHILEGIDHLAFVFLLLLTVRRLGALLWAVTAFSAAHSITLALSTFGLLALPPGPVETLIALSIAVLAAELLQPGGPGLTARAPWAVAFAFGLLHGLGFAGALREIGLPQGDVPPALLAFNLGVEAGQLMFIAACLALGRAGAWALGSLRGDAAAGAALLRRASAWGLGSLAAYWAVERAAALYV